jgi:hypothetical protein
MSLNLAKSQGETGAQALGWRLDSARLTKREAGNEARSRGRLH